MRRKSLSCVVVTVVVMGAGIWISGCSFSTTYQVNGIVKDAIDGKPLAGVAVYFETPMLERQIMVDDPANSKATPDAITAADGTFSFTKHESDPSSSTVFLFFHGKGYVVEQFRVGVGKKSGHDEPITVFVGIALRPESPVKPEKTIKS